MSTTLYFLIPISMLAVAWSLCFVGCFLQTSGLASPYSDAILTDPNLKPILVAYWPLNDLIGPQLNEQTNKAGPTAFQAQDLSGNGHVGTYVIPFAYPPPTPALPSAQITNPSLQRGATIVAGDAGSTKNPLAASADFGGGFVSIPWSSQNSPQLDQFTFEGWVQPKWTGSGARRVVFGALGPGDATGFVIFIDENNQWQIVVGTGAGNMPLQTMIPIDPTSTTSTYVAVTCDQNTNVSLWINPAGQGDTDNTPPPPPPTWPPAPMATGYTATPPSQLATIFIGTGQNEVTTVRTQDGGAGAPLFPFQGLIQSIALYDAALDAATLQSHFLLGSGS